MIKTSGREKSRFIQAVTGEKLKIQVGVRRQKRGPDWVAVDLYDKSALIDHNWDILDIPLADCSVDSFMCNAILEHVYEPQLAIYEMYRTLKIGGNLWVEVPFNQFYHAHPLDFRRWTIPGLEWEMRRFQKVSSGMTPVSHEVKKVINSLNKQNQASVDESLIPVIEKIMDDYTDSAEFPRLYSGCFFWGRKTDHHISDCEKGFMQQLRADINETSSNRVL